MLGITLITYNTTEEDRMECYRKSIGAWKEIRNKSAKRVNVRVERYHGLFSKEFEIETETVDRIMGRLSKGFYCTDTLVQGIKICH